MMGRLGAIAKSLSILIVCAEWGRAADPTQRPPVVEVRQQMAAPVAGWSVAMDDLPHRLAGITFFDGKPEEKASLAPDSETKAAGKSVSTWNFGSGGRPVWVACRYAWTTETLTRALPKPVLRCAVIYNPRKSLAVLPLIQQIDCKKGKA